MKGAYI